MTKPNPIATMIPTISKPLARRGPFCSPAVSSVSEIVCLVLFLSMKAESFTVRSGYYSQYSQTGVQMLSLSAKIMDRSSMSCAATCLLMHRQCFSYIYHHATRECTPGAYVHLHPLTLPSPISGVLYTDSAIDVNLTNFNVYFKEDVIVYLHISTETADYGTAFDTCQKMGGQLYTTREAVKYRLLEDLVQGNYEGMWIGLDDLDEEGVFRWVDDKSVLTTEIGDVIWGRNQPDNHDNDQHCCFWWDFYNAVADFHCDNLYNYACEYPVPYRY